MDLLRTGDPADWKTVRWSLLDDSSQGTFVNQSRIECGKSVTLNADDLIGFGCGDESSSRQEGRETFVYKLRAPEAFLNLVRIASVLMFLKVSLNPGNF